jgi:hypothetical protein
MARAFESLKEWITLRQITIALILISLCMFQLTASATEQALTVRTNIDLQGVDLSSVEDLQLIGITTSAQSEFLELVWHKDNNAWGFPFWRLSLQASASLLPDILTGAQVDIVDRDSKRVSLAMLTPESGRNYEAYLSYSAISGTVSIALLDVVAQVELFQKELQMRPQPNPQLPQVTPPVSPGVRLVQAEPGYVPVGLEWRLTALDDQLVGINLLSGGNPAVLYVAQALGTTSGRFRLIADTGAEELVLWEGNRADLVNSQVVPTYQLPYGKTQVRLEYLDGEKAWTLGRKRLIDVYTGTLNVGIGSVSFSENDITGQMVITTDAPMKELSLSLLARVSVKQGDVWRLLSGEPLLWQTKVPLEQAGDETISFSLETPGLGDGPVLVETSWLTEVEQGWRVLASNSTYELTKPAEPWYSPIPVLDISGDRGRVTVIDSVIGEYMGHPDTVLMADGRTMFVVYPLGHGGPTVLRRSDNGGLDWSSRLPTPDNWRQTANVPTIFRLTDPQGIERLVVFNNMTLNIFSPGTRGKDLHQSISADNGQTWTPFQSNGIYTQVAPNTVVPISGNRYLTVYQIDGRIAQSISADGGLTWTHMGVIARHPVARLTEPALIASPDGKQLAVLIRENSRQFNSMLIVSNDEGATWSEPVELPDVLTGDRHMPHYADDGRLVITFRDRCVGSPTYGDFVAWVGTYDDLVNLRNGDYRVRLLNSFGQARDTGYSGLELLPDGTMVATTYAPLYVGAKPSVVSVRFSLEELDAMLSQSVE